MHPWVHAMTSVCHVLCCVWMVLSGCAQGVPSAALQSPKQFQFIDVATTIAPVPPAAAGEATFAAVRSALSGTKPS